MDNQDDRQKWKIIIKIEGLIGVPNPVPPLVLAVQVNATSYADAAKQTYRTYRTGLRYIYKEMEMAISMERIPNKVFSVEVIVDDEPLDSDPLIDAYFEIRKEHWLEALAASGTTLMTALGDKLKTVN